MKKRLFTAALFTTALCLAALAPVAAQAGERGVFGFSITVDAEGVFWNPTLRSVTIAKVAPASPAALGGMAVGDEVLEVEGHTVPGAKGKDIQALIAKDVGQTLQVKLKHKNGETATVVLTAAAKSAAN